MIAEAIQLAEGRDGFNSVSINTDIADDLIVPGDESKLRRTINNLVSNAIDIQYYKNVADAAISITAKTEGNHVVIRVSDNGPGIPVEIIGTLFEPFVTRNKSNGTGLGLAIVKQFIQAHGGTIEVANNGGAVFTITLPL